MDDDGAWASGGLADDTLGSFNSMPLAEALIAAGADIHIAASDGTTAGSTAAQTNRSDDLLALFDRLGAYSTRDPTKGPD